MNKEQLIQIEKDMNSLQTKYKFNKNLKFKNIDADNVFYRKPKLYDMNKFIDLHCDKMMYYNQHRIEVLKNMYESDEIEREVFMEKVKQIHKSNEFVGEQCYVDRIEVLKKIMKLNLNDDIWF